MDLVPEIPVRSGEFSWRGCVGGRQPVDVRQGGDLPSSCLVGTDIGLETGGEAAH